MNTMIKRMLAVTSAVTMILSMAACTAQPTPQTDETEQSTSEAVNYGTMEDTTIQVEPLELTDEWDKVFPLSDEVNHRKVTFVNHFGITLAAMNPKNIPVNFRRLPFVARLEP